HARPGLPFAECLVHGCSSLRVCCNSPSPPLRRRGVGVRGSCSLFRETETPPHPLPLSPEAGARGDFEGGCRGRLPLRRLVLRDGLVSGHEIRLGLRAVNRNVGEFAPLSQARCPIPSEPRHGRRRFPGSPTWGKPGGQSLVAAACCGPY